MTQDPNYTESEYSPGYSSYEPEEVPPTSPPPVDYAPMEDTGEKNDNTTLIIILVVAALLILCCCCVVVLGVILSSAEGFDQYGMELLRLLVA